VFNISNPDRPFEDGRLTAEASIRRGSEYSDLYNNLNYSQGPMPLNPPLKMVSTTRRRKTATTNMATKWALFTA